MRAFWLPAAETAGVLLLLTAVGATAAGALLPRGGTWRLERIGWGLCVGSGLLAATVPLCLVCGARPGWIPLFVLSGLLLAVVFPLRVRSAAGSDMRPRSVPAQSRPIAAVLWTLLLCGVLLYALRALTEPMWSNDYLAIWGLKGKTIFGAVSLPDRLFRSTVSGFAHPEYPLGLPFLFASLSFLLGRWDDHAMALLFPALQSATLLVTAGWLRRRGTPRPLPLAAAALLSLFEPLYSGFLIGMAEVPLSCGMLLFGTALSDACDGTDRGARRRLAVASALVAATKNEGLFLAFTGALLAWISPEVKGRRARLSLVAASLAPAAGLTVLDRVVRGSFPLRDFDFGLFSPARVADLPRRIAETARAASAEPSAAGWLGLVCLALLLVAGRRSRSGDRLLIQAGLCLAAYILLPALALRGPGWLVRAALGRTAAALAPLLTAGIAVRLGGVLAVVDPAQPQEVPEGREGVTQDRDLRLG